MNFLRNIFKLKPSKARFKLKYFLISLIIFLGIVKLILIFNLIKNGEREIESLPPILEDKKHEYLKGIYQNIKLESKKSKNKKIKIAIISTYPKDQCGIAEFAKNMVNGMLRAVKENCKGNCDIEIGVIKIQKNRLGIFDEATHGEIVKYIIRLGEKPLSWEIKKAADYIINSEYNHVFLHGEFGLTPILWQQLDLVRRLKGKVCLYYLWHSPIAFPNIEEREQSYQIAKYVDKVILMSHYSIMSAIHAYGIDKSKLVFIPHAIRGNDEIRETPDPKLVKIMEKKDGQIILLTNGFINKSKGYMRFLNAMKYVVESCPNIKLIIVGKAKDFLFLNQLKNRAAKLNLTDKMIIYDRYVSLDTLDYCIKKADIYFTLYNEVTPVSGVLTNAMSLGVPIISTPYRYAIEMIGYDNEKPRGIVVNTFNNSKKIADAFIKLIENPSLRNEMGENAKNYLSNFLWKNIGAHYLSLLNINDVIIEKEEIHLKPEFFGLKKDLPAFWKCSNAQFFNGYSIYQTRDKKFQKSELYDKIIATYNGQKLGGYILNYVILRKRSLNPFPGHNLAQSGLVFNIFGDQHIVINGVINRQMELISLGIRSRDGWFLIDNEKGLDIQLIDDQIPDNIKFDINNNTLEISTPNVKIIRASLIKIGQKKEIRLLIDGVNRFSYPMGIIGKSLRSVTDLYKPLDISSNAYLNSWIRSLIVTGNIFSSDTEDMKRTIYGYRCTIFKPVDPDLLPRTNPPLYMTLTNSNQLYPNYISLTTLKSQGYKIKDNQIPCIFIEMKGPFFDNQGFSKVNSYHWFQIQKAYLRPWLLPDIIKKLKLNSSIKKYPLKLDFFKTKILIKVTIENDSNQIPDTSNIIQLLIWENYKSPYIDFSSHFNINEKNNDPDPDFIYVNKWNKDGHTFESIHDSFLIYVLPWEFGPIPKKWIKKIISNVDGIWTTSKYCLNNFLESGITPKNTDICYIHHGVDNFKYKYAGKDPLKLLESNHEDKFNLFFKKIEAKMVSDCNPKTERSLRFLYSGTLVPRKGLYILYKAYVKAFKRKDFVILIINSGGNRPPKYLISHMLRYRMATKDPNLIKKNPKLYDIPKLIFINSNLSEKDMIKLKKACDYYVAPYRSEGFGLGMIESLACGIPLIITGKGPSIEFTKSNFVQYIKTSNKPIDCLISPCGKKKIFNFKLKKNPKWFQVSYLSLASILFKNYKNFNNRYENFQNDMIKIKKDCITAAEKKDWSKAGQLLIYKYITFIYYAGFSKSAKRQRNFISKIRRKLEL